MLRVPPPGPVRLDVALGALLERHRPGGVELLPLQRIPFRLYRIDPVKPLPPAVLRPPTRLGEEDRVQRSEPHFLEGAAAGL
jgi:hypothetical protein